MLARITRKSLVLKKRKRIWIEKRTWANTHTIEAKIDFVAEVWILYEIA